MQGKRVVREKWGSEEPGNPAEGPDISEEERDERLAFCRGRMQIAITMENKGRVSAFQMPPPPRVPVLV